MEPDQPPLPFLAEFDQQVKREAEIERTNQALLRAESYLKHMVKNHPPDDVEWEIMVMGIRIDRFVNYETECKICAYATTDHTINWMFPTKICVKDYMARCQQWGIKPRVARKNGGHVT